MGTILLSAFCALALNVQSVEIKKDTIDKYVIDKQVIERFNGSQLEGKTISKYIIAYKDEGNVVEKTHIIYTDSTNSPVGNMIVNLDKPVNGQKLETLIVVDGKEISSSDFRKMNAEEIASMQVYKADSKMAKSYGEKGRDGVLWITTKANKASENIFFIDGRRAEKSEIDKLSPDKIANISVNKEKGISVIKVVTKK